MTWTSSLHSCSVWPQLANHGNNLCHLHINSSFTIPQRTPPWRFDSHLLTKLPQLVWLQPFQLFLQLLSVEPSLTWRLKWCFGGAPRSSAWFRMTQKAAPYFRSHLLIYILHQAPHITISNQCHYRGSKSYKIKIVFQWRNDPVLALQGLVKIGKTAQTCNTGQASVTLRCAILSQSHCLVSPCVNLCESNSSGFFMNFQQQKQESDKISSFLP